MKVKIGYSLRTQASFMETMLPDIYQDTFTILPNLINENNHVSNVTNVQWMQDVAIMNSDAVGCIIHRELRNSFQVKLLSDES